jgi:penicillin-binding protein 2
MRSQRRPEGHRQLLGRSGGLDRRGPCLVSSPSFDPNLFNGGILSDDWERLASPRHPWKPVDLDSTAGLHLQTRPCCALEGLIPEMSCIGNGTLHGKWTFRCWQAKGHGNVSLHRPRESCDVYFYNLGKATWRVDKIAAAAPSTGVPLGIDLTREKGGLIPTKQWKLSRFREPWQPGETISISIGQGFNLVTPLQLANVYATLGNGGTLYRPRLVKQLESSDGHVVKVGPGLAPCASTQKPSDHQSGPQGAWWKKAGNGL